MVEEADTDDHVHRRPDGDGCRVTRRIEMEPQGLMRVMAPFMGGMPRSSNAGFLANLKRVLETEADRAQN
jgi:hypothetical protein